MCCIYWASFVCGTVVVVVLLLLLLCNDVDLTKEKKHGDLWAFHTFPHRAGYGSFDVLFLFYLPFLAVYLPFCLRFLTSSTWNFAFVLHAYVSSLFLIPLVFIYIMGSLYKCGNDCVQEQRDKSHLYSNLGRIHWSKILTGFAGKLFSFILSFPWVLQKYF